jgi:glycine oxidase
MAGSSSPVELWPEGSVDPRALGAAAVKANKHRGTDIASGTPVTEVLISEGKVAGVKTAKTHFSAGVVVNCAGAWAGNIPSPVQNLPVRPRKGQMVAVVSPQRDLVRHVIRSPEVYLVPRSNGRILIGTTVEDVGFEKRTEPAVIQRLHQAAANLVPELGQLRISEAWAGLRPGAPDDLPILGPTPVAGYYAATGHFRDGILLAPVTAMLMAQVIQGQSPEIDLAPFSPARFES